MQTFLITCKKTKYRLKKALEVLNNLSLKEITIIDDYDIGSENFNYEKDKLYISNKRLWRQYTFNRTEYRKLTDEEISLFLKHRKCWQTIASSKQNESFLILEDDIALEDDKENISRKLSSIKDAIFDNNIKYDLIYIGESCKINLCMYRNLIKYLYKNKTLYRVLFGFFSDSYIINKYSATKLIEDLKTISSPIDEYLIYSSRILKIYEPRTPLLTQNKAYSSSIQVKKKSKNYKISLKDRVFWYLNMFERVVRIILQSNKIFK